MVDRLPRDVQLEVLKRAGMDARIALGLIGRLRVPQRVVDALSAIRRPQDLMWVSRVRLGVYTLQFDERHIDPTRRVAVVPACWIVYVYKPAGYQVLELQTMDISYDRTTWTMAD